MRSSPLSPEARRQRLSDARARVEGEMARRPVLARSVDVIRRVAIGVYSDGFIHAGNLAYLTLVALFPFFIVAAAIAQLLGETEIGLRTLNAFLQTVPPDVADVLRGPVGEVLSLRTGNLLWFGALVGLWTVGSLIETIRDILRRAYGTTPGHAFWHYRLASIGIIVLSVLAAMFAFSVQVMAVAVTEFLHRVLPFADDAIAIARAVRLIPTAILFVALYFLFVALTPGRYRARRFPKWPGPLVTTLWWYGTALLLPVVLAQFADYSLTYGGLAGAMVTLIFFFIIGLGVVIGAELNAALADFTGDGALGNEEDRPA